MMDNTKLFYEELEAYKQVLNKYRMKEDAIPNMTPKIHKMLIGEADRFFWMLVEKGAAKEEIKKAARYLHICVDTLKHRLDYIRYREENGINQIAETYGFELRKWKVIA